MIKPYVYIEHDIQHLHADVTSTLLYILDNNIALFTRDTLQGRLINVFRRKGTKLEKYFEGITTAFANLDGNQKEFIRNAIENNNRIEDLCNNDIQPTLYESIGIIISEEFRNLLHDFYYFLWEESYDYDGIIEQYGTIADHHNRFKLRQRIRVCPLCGITGLKPPGRKVREAYDHYLPKTYYPFNSINLYNLVPTCHYCNSDEKTTDNIIVDNNSNSRRAFYPFSNEDYSIEVAFEVTGNEEELSLTDVEWHPNYSCNGIQDDRLQSWVTVYKIDSRYVQYSVYNETVWRGAIIDKYNDAKQRGEDFKAFKGKYLSQFRSQLTRPLDLLEKAYAEYFLNKPNIEAVLAEWDVI